ncbi:MAG: hypothetical protein AB7F61_14610 [Desulfobulbus sp.]
MNRVRLFLVGLLALLFPCHLLAYGIGDSIPMSDGQSYKLVSVTTSGNWASGPTLDSIYNSHPHFGKIEPGSLPAGWSNPQGEGFEVIVFDTFVPYSFHYVHYYAVLDNPVCNIADDDADGVCNSCDKYPGTPDKKHCIWYQMKIPLLNKIAFSVVDRSGNCDGSDTVIFANSNFPDATTSGVSNGYLYPTGKELKINPPTCSGDDGSGQCKCDYDFNNIPELIDQSQVVEVQLSDDLLNQLQSNDSQLEDSNTGDCAIAKSSCSSACTLRGGVVTNKCSASGNFSYSECECGDDFGYKLANPTETNDNPDTDSSENGDVADTGGSDNNSDGTDDTYAAVKGAIKDSGILSKQDRTNNLLGQLSNDLSVIDSSVKGLGGKIDKIGNGVSGLGSTLNSINDKIGNGFDVSGSADLPSTNEYNSSVDDIEENSLVDAIGDFISNGLPLIDYFRGSYINIDSASPVISAVIFGKIISIDFTGTEDILHDMGLVLISVCTILAFMIVVG